MIANPDDLTIRCQTQLPPTTSPNLLKFIIGMEPNPSANDSCSPFFQEIGHGLSNSDGLWLSIPNSHFKLTQSLTEGEIIRFGRQIFRVAKTLSGNHLAEERKRTNWLTKLAETVRLLGKGPPPGMRKVVSVHPVPNSNHLRRVCLLCEDENDPCRPLLQNLCDCPGTVHLDCLHAVMNYKTRRENKGNLSFFDLTEFWCPLCGCSLEPFTRVRKHTFGLFDFDYSQSTHLLVLEKISLDGPFVDGVLFIDFTDRGSKPVLLGTDADCDVVLSQRHCSAVHAQFVQKKNAFYVVNLSSKFGTLRKLDEKVDVKWLNESFIVCGPFLFYFHIHTEGSQRTCCGKGIHLEEALAHETSLLDSILMSSDNPEDEDRNGNSKGEGITPHTADTNRVDGLKIRNGLRLSLRGVRDGQLEGDDGLMSPNKV